MLLGSSMYNVINQNLSQIDEIPKQSRASTVIKFRETKVDINSHNNTHCNFKDEDKLKNKSYTHIHFDPLMLINYHSKERNKNNKKIEENLFNLKNKIKSNFTNSRMGIYTISNEKIISESSSK